MSEQNQPESGGFRFGDLLAKLNSENIDPLNPGLKDRLNKLLIAPMYREHLARYEMVESLFNPDQVHRAADLATGQGYGVKILRQSFPEAEIVGVDIDTPSLRKATQRYGETFAKTDVVELPMASNDLDLVTAFEITEHLNEADQEKFLREIWRVLKPGGTAVISIPEPYSLTDEGKPGASHNPHHLNELSREELLVLFDKVGLELMDEYGQGFIDHEEHRRRRKWSAKLPIWAFLAWTGRPESEFEVEPIKDHPDKVALTHIFVVKKPAEK